MNAITPTYLADDYYGPAGLRSEYRAGNVDRGGFQTLRGQIRDWESSVRQARYRVQIAIKSLRKLRDRNIADERDTRHVSNCIADYRNIQSVLRKLRATLASRQAA